MADDIQRTIYKLEIDDSAYIKGVESLSASTKKLYDNKLAANKEDGRPSTDLTVNDIFIFLYIHLALNLCKIRLLLSFKLPGAASLDAHKPLFLQL